MRPETCLVMLLLFFVSACSGDSTVAGDAAADVGYDSVAPVEVLETRGGDSVSETKARPRPGKPFDSKYVPFAEPIPGPRVYVTRVGAGNPDENVAFYVFASQLGSIAGLAFYIEFDPEVVDLVKAVPLANLGAEQSVFTKSVAKELEPGLVTFGVARFCKAKSPWGGSEQCGGRTVDEPVPMMSLEFKMKSPGQSPLRFLETRRIIRRPDRSLVEATWIGGTVHVDQDKWR